MHINRRIPDSYIYIYIRLLEEIYLEIESAFSLEQES